MTNSEIALEKINDLICDCNDGYYHKGIECDCIQYPCRLYIIKRALEENDKLKAEIDELTEQNKVLSKKYKFKNGSHELQEKEIEQLRKELEQSEITRNKQIDVLLQEIEQLKSIINAYEVKKDFKEFCDSRDKEEGELKFREVE